jgi:hypothetical protein
MTTGAMLRLLAEVAEELKHDGPLRVVPIVGDGLVEHVDLVRAVAESLRAGFVDISDPSSSGPVAGSTPAGLEAAMDAFLSIERPGGTRKIRITPGADLDVEFDDGSQADAASPADRQVLGLARVFLSDENPERSTLFLLYDETLGMDRTTMRACWDFLVGGVSGLSIRDLQTVVVFVNARNIDVGRHCRRTVSGFRFGLSGDRLLKRSGEPSFVAKLTRLRDSSRPIVFFLGAGFSASSGLPLGNTLRDSAIRTLLNLQPDAPIEFDQLNAFRSFATDNGLLSQGEVEAEVSEFFRTLTLEQVVRIERDWLGTTPTLDAFAEMNGDALPAPGSSIHDMARLMASGRKLILVTVNFDTLVETVATAALNVFADVGEFPNCLDHVERYLAGDDDRIPYLKVHGTISTPETCVVTDDATRGGLPAVVARALEGVLEVESELVYIGASMRDRDLAPFFARREVADRQHELWVSPYLDDDIWRFVAEYRMELAGWGPVERHVVTETADVFMAELASFLA